MKRHDGVWPQIVDFGNLLQATRQPPRGKRGGPDVMAFHDRLEPKLLAIEDESLTRAYRPGGYHTFRIVTPEKRIILAVPYRDRVVHHALCNVIPPIFDAGFIADSSANRCGLGMHRALRRFTRASRCHLQADIRKYFPSIDHAILREQVGRRVSCPDTLWLIDAIIDGSNEQELALAYFPGGALFEPHARRRGLPIGSLASPFFANVYLDSLDHLANERVGVRRYLRYVDDFALLGDDRTALADARCAVEDHLAGLRLRLHPAKTQLFETRVGAGFVGFRVLRDRVCVRADVCAACRVSIEPDAPARARSQYRSGARLHTWSAPTPAAPMEHLQQPRVPEGGAGRSIAAGVAGRGMEQRCMEQQCEELSFRGAQQQRPEEQEPQRRRSGWCVLFREFSKACAVG